MALYVKQDDERTELQQRIAAELREKQKRNSLENGEIEPPSRNGLTLDNSKYLEGTKETTGLAFVWLLLTVAILVAIGYFIWFSKA